MKTVNKLPKNYLVKFEGQFDFKHFIQQLIVDSNTSNFNIDAPYQVGLFYGMHTTGIKDTAVRVENPDFQTYDIITLEQYYKLRFSK